LQLFISDTDTSIQRCAVRYVLRSSNATQSQHGVLLADAQGNARDLWEQVSFIHGVRPVVWPFCDQRDLARLRAGLDPKSPLPEQPDSFFERQGIT
jgi:hypothetical protein